MRISLSDNGLRRVGRWFKHAPDRAFHPLRRRAVWTRLARRGPPRAVLVLCHGNICRSPYAAAALRRCWASTVDSPVQVESAGFVGSGRPCPRSALTEALGRGSNLAAHRSTPVAADAVARADLVVVMDGRQKRALWERFGRGDAIVLGDLDPMGVSARGIVDPVNGTPETFAACYDRIDRCVASLVEAVSGSRRMKASASGNGRSRGLTAVPLIGARSRAAGVLRFPGAGRPAHHFTVDLEEYFQVAALESCVPMTAWAQMESRVARSTYRLLRLLDAHGAQATFFVLGWVARRHPNLVRALAAAGHEIASHGWDHQRITLQGPRQFRRSICRTKRLLEDTVGAAVVGFRAPNFSVVPGSEWALDVLLEEGYRYDSSVFPIRRPGYGYPGAPREPHWIERPAGRLFEFPPATLRRFGVTVPAGGGAYFRWLPYRMAASALREFEAAGSRGTFYIHPWELDPEQPRLETSWPVRLRHYGRLDRVGPRLERLLGEFRFTRISETVSAYGLPEVVPCDIPEAERGNGAAAAR